ncbi:MAG TPA: hypothetical protein VI756_21610 [Blastocatellia bacterium]
MQRQSFGAADILGATTPYAGGGGAKSGNPATACPHCGAADGGFGQVFPVRRRPVPRSVARRGDATGAQPDRAARRLRPVPQVRPLARSSLLPGSIAPAARDIDRNQATRLLIEARRRSLA